MTPLISPTLSQTFVSTYNVSMFSSFWIEMAGWMAVHKSVHVFVGRAGYMINMGNLNYDANQNGQGLDSLLRDLIRSHLEHPDDANIIIVNKVS